MQVLQPILDPGFSEYSYGFRPGRRAGERVMAMLRKLYIKLRLKVNEAKSAVASVFSQRKFLGYSLWRAPIGVVKRKVATKALDEFKHQIRSLTRRSAGQSMQQVIDRLRLYILGWKAYFRLAQTPGVWRELDQWIRHRLRAIQLRQWKRGTTMYLELIAMGASPVQAHRITANSRRWWRNSAKSLNGVLTIGYFERLGLPRLS